MGNPKLAAYHLEAVTHPSKPLDLPSIDVNGGFHGPDGTSRDPPHALEQRLPLSTGFIQLFPQLGGLEKQVEPGGGFFHAVDEGLDPYLGPTCPGQRTTQTYGLSTCVDGRRMCADRTGSQAFHRRFTGDSQAPG